MNKKIIILTILAIVLLTISSYHIYSIMVTPFRLVLVEDPEARCLDGT
jgi:hypothetical protein